jgi:hypothetical protein
VRPLGVHVEWTPDGAASDQLVRRRGGVAPLDHDRADRAPLEGRPGDAVGGFTDPDRPGRGHLLQTGRQVCRVALGGVVHAEVIADPAHDDRPRVDADPHLEGQPEAPLDRVAVPGQVRLDRQGGLERSDRVGPRG